MGRLSDARDKASDLWGAINYFIDLQQNTCDEPWQLYLETALPAVGEALYLVLVPDPDNILEGMVQPKGGRKDPRRKRDERRRRRQGRTAPRASSRGPSIFDMDEAVGRRFASKALHRGTKLGSPTRWGWAIHGILERLTWWWLIIDVTADGIIQWQSNLMKSTFCENPHDILLVARNTRVSTHPQNAQIVEGGDGIEWKNVNNQVGQPFEITPVLDGATMQISASATGVADDLNGVRKGQTKYRIRIAWIEPNKIPHHSDGPIKLVSNNDNWQNSHGVIANPMYRAGAFLLFDTDGEPPEDGPALHRHSGNMTWMGNYLP